MKMTELPNLTKKIGVKKQQLVQHVQEEDALYTTECVVEKSQELDRLIIQYLQLTNAEMEEKRK